MQEITGARKNTQADWKAIGVEAELVQNESQIAYAAYRARDFEVGDTAWIVGAYVKSSVAMPRTIGSTMAT